MLTCSGLILGVMYPMNLPGNRISFRSTARSEKRTNWWWLSGMVALPLRNLYT